jgi:hypothetical protein
LFLLLNGTIDVAQMPGIELSPVSPIIVVGNR